MSTAPELPALPTAFAPFAQGIPGFTADQMLTYRAACAAQEREACAKVAEDTATGLLPTGSCLSERCAAAIRARGAA